MTGSANAPANLLLVDDETAITHQLAPLLERSGFAVRVVHDGLAALSAVEAEEPDLIVLDVLMPGLDGREVLRRLPRYRPGGRHRRFRRHRANRRLRRP